DSRAHAQEHATFQFVDRVTDREKVAIAGRAERGRIEVRMFMQNVVADANVRRNRHIQSHTGGKNAEVLMRIIAFENMAANRFTQAQSPERTFANNVVNLARFAPQAKFAAANVASDTFTRGTDPRQLVIMNRPRAVQANVRNPAALHQVDELP